MFFYLNLAEVRSVALLSLPKQYSVAKDILCDITTLYPLEFGYVAAIKLQARTVGLGKSGNKKKMANFAIFH